MKIKIFALIKQKTHQALHSPFGFQVVCFVFLFLFLMGFRPSTFGWGEEFFPISDFDSRNIHFKISEDGFLDNNFITGIDGNIYYVVEEDGETQVVFTSIKSRENIEEYKVRSGDTIQKIAKKFNLKISTLLWANKMTVKDVLPINKILQIPPTDGVFYTVKEGDTFGEIAKLHKSTTAEILSFNNIKNVNILSIGTELFIPGSGKIFIPSKPIIVKHKPLSKQIGSIGFKILRPVQGVITQGYRRGHYALDIANRLNTPIYASAEGKVIRSSDGWNYGYGKMIEVDHGNGIITLYSHLNSRKIAVGEKVSAGQLIGLMGNTGNVFGPTGIHLHFELHINGRKVNPYNYF